jgi:hypothetical protein
VALRTWLDHLKGIDEKKANLSPPLAIDKPHIRW